MSEEEMKVPETIDLASMNMVAGGRMSEEMRADILMVIQEYKREGWDLEAFLDHFDNTMSDHDSPRIAAKIAEQRAFIVENWDS